MKDERSRTGAHDEIYNMHKSEKRLVFQPVIVLGILQKKSCSPDISVSL